ncbi:phosphatidylinositol-glycan biosynthesis class S protein-domain-containing protein [Crucibulum laeve]|uniref:Phosphatidylinositol-glycan biosynthesis class S protein-domain-containing protein n=1 Tax=Crucibulum laeve TaxID=68775 RepID=A0A5C3LNH0_9AGAR|nr:phosphatidylinositol-glycan biosynthesis class S protein-domain-containing protein [Crucibulum laeve]
MSSMDSHSPPQDAQNAPKQPSTALRDPSKLFYQSDGVHRSIIASYWAVILLAVPLWWYTTSIERLSLPQSRVYSQAENHLRLPVRICLVAGDQQLAGQLQDSIQQHVAKASERWNGLKIDVLQQGQCNSNDGSYSVIPSDKGITLEARQLSYPLADGSSVSKLVDTLSALIVPYSAASEQEHRVAQYSPRYRLSFSLLNEDAAAGKAIIGWDVEQAINRYIHPILSRLSTLHNFTIESQVQFHAPLAFTPQELDVAYALTSEDLTVFVNSAEWTLSSSASNDPVLHFVLFIPSSDRRPLKIANADGSLSASGAFLLPQWGGIVIHNPTPQDVPSDTDLPPTDLDQVFSVFSNQLLALLGVPHLPVGVQRGVSEREALITDWQLDALLRRRALENAEGAQDTLRSIVKLVDQIENMPVGEDVKGDVQDALAALDKMYASSRTSLEQAFRYSAQALTLASRAFFNPGMLALLYFPTEHRVAVYTPLFASALVPLFVAVLKEFFAWRRQRKLLLANS